MAKYNIKKAVFVPTGQAPDNFGYDKNMRELLLLQKKFPDKIIAFATVNASDLKAPAIFENAVKNGALGLKLIDWHSSFNPAYPIDSPVVISLLRIAEKNRLPVLFHVEIDKYPDQKIRLENVVKMFPRVNFILAHYCGALENVSLCGDLLTKYQNVYADVTLGVGLSSFPKTISANAQKFRGFVIDNQDKILFGDDVIIEPDRITPQLLETRFNTDFDLLEKETYETDLIKNTPLKGLSLPAVVLRKIYYENAARILYH
jgi:predicted TIM-barrel fold metal-dependent hydrolase